MIYLDTSVVLAQLLAEDRKPPDSIWDGALVSSRLLQYETWVRIHALGLGDTHAEPARQLLARLSFLELFPVVLARAPEPYEVGVRTLDALHLASVEYLLGQRLDVRLASYDDRMLDAATHSGITIEPL